MENNEYDKTYSENSGLVGGLQEEHNGWWLSFKSYLVSVQKAVSFSHYLWDTDCK